MDIEMFCICDHAQVITIKPVIIGVFDTLSPPALPAHVQCSVYWRVRFRSSEFGRNSFEISIVDPDGKARQNPLQGEFEIGVGAVTDTVAAELAIGLGLDLKSFGKLTFNLKMNGTLLRSIPLYVLPPQRVN